MKNDKKLILYDLLHNLPTHLVIQKANGQSHSVYLRENMKKKDTHAYNQFGIFRHMKTKRTEADSREMKEKQ